MAAAFPSMLEYQEAVQNPRTCFSDPELAGGSPVLDPLGLPKPISGGFASVYQVKAAKKHFAVRCFLRSHAEVQDRYARISDFQRQHRPRWMAEFVYLAQGIKVRGQWYPILKMEWIPGEQLNVYIDQLRGDRKALGATREKFLALVKTMKKLGVAHGDLQHGNILVAGGDLRLIDYDAMYVPGMTGRSHEVGHRNFQHPKRSERDFDGNLDHFSAWVIAIALKGLTLHPGLWQELAGGDESLLLRKEDYLKPDSSKSMLALDRIADAGLREELAYLRLCLAGDASAVKSPLEPPARQSPPAAQAAPQPAAPPAAVQAAFGAPAAATPPPSTGAPELLTTSVTPERTALALTLLGWAAAFGAFWRQLLPYDQAGAASGILLVLVGLFYVVRFAVLPQVRRLRAHLQEFRDLTRRLERSEFKAKALADLDACFATSRRLDFDALLAKVDTHEGQAVLASLMAYLEEQPLAGAPVAGVDQDLSRRLARRGLKDALRLGDIIVARSLADGEAAESITVVLRNGKGIEDPGLTRVQAEALLAWRGALEKQFVKTASGEARLQHQELKRRATELEGLISCYVNINGWRYLGLIFGVT